MKIGDLKVGAKLFFGNYGANETSIHPITWLKASRDNEFLSEFVLDLLKFDEALDGADVVITGEGCSDSQTLCGKLPAAVSERAGKKGVPVILLSGALGKDSKALEEKFSCVFTLSSGAVSLQEALDSAPQNLVRMAKAIVNLLRISR